MNTSIKAARNLFQTIAKEFDFDLKTISLSKVKELITEIIDFNIDENWENFGNNKDHDYFKSLKTLVVCSHACDCTFEDYTIAEIMDFILEIAYNTEDDFWLELPCGEVRLINEDEIDEIWTESLIEQVKDCYDLSDVPYFVAIDWEQTAENCKVDGMGHHFASYDGEEHYSNGFHIFRTN